MERVPSPPAPETPDRIGPYKILDTLGQGGMGIVYLAEQKEPVRRRVALKVIKLGMDSRQVLARFELERQALAVMNHPTIAKVFEAGITEHGQPYFVMEFVEGAPLTDYCDTHKLSLKERIGIFQQVCRGVQHAHQKGVVHRDLKPGNILLSQKGDEHAAKIIDFGLARATGQELIDRTIYTEQGQLIGTPEYMSPEQASGVALQIDTRSDVYSLGVVLYELLTGALPFTSPELRQAGLMEIQRIIAEVEPEKPSSKISSAGDTAAVWAQNRRISTAALRRQLKGDLDWIVLRAMAKEPERRFGSALGLALDLGKYLEHEPVEAGPPSAVYRLSKFARKYRVQVSAAALIVTVAIVGAIVALQYAREAIEQESIAKEKADEADREREEARRQEGLAKNALAQVEVEQRKSDANLARFIRLSVVVQLEDAQKELETLQPAWPEQIPKMKAWLDNRGKRLAEALPEVRQTLRELEDKAPARTEAEKEADREGHPEYPTWQKQRKKVESLRRAAAVRKNDVQVVDAALPETTPADASAINSIAWPKVSPDPKERKWGDEALALTLARHAAQLAETQQRDKRHMVGDTLAWALFANGLDAEAKAASEAALAAAPAAEKRDYEGYLDKLTQAIAGAEEALAEAERDLLRLENAVNERQTYRFADEADAFLHETMQRAERELVVFLGNTGARLDVQRRLAWAERVDATTRNHPNAQITWAEVREALGKADGVVASELYSANRHEDHPVDLKEQTGLVPIGMNPVTKLWEFYHLRSAFDPRTDTDPAVLAIPKHAEDGSIPTTEAMGVVFVLLPGGTYTMGAQKTDPKGANYDPQARRDETPRQRTVAPFFLARHELTQGQWVRLSLKANPSRFVGNGNQADFVGGVVTLAHPVEHVDWTMCAKLMARHGLQLPHEIEWEYGCRAGEAKPWFCGATSSELDGFANILDAVAKKHAPWQGAHVAFADGFVIHARVATYNPNAFGLYDVHGNVWEWCRNIYPDGSHHRVLRGGGFDFAARYARCANRDHNTPSFRVSNLGLRPARTVER